MELVSDPISSGIFKITTPNNFEPWKEKRIRAGELAELENNTQAWGLSSAKCNGTYLKL